MPQSTPFLGSCEVCGKAIRNYRGLSQHLRFNTDPAHQDLKRRWHEWRDQYRATLRCRKCGTLFEITDKSQKDRKRCDRCEHLRQTMSKRAYEALTFDKPKDPRRVDKNSNSKARWSPGYQPEVEWEPGDALYVQIQGALHSEEPVSQSLKRLGISYKVYREMAEHLLGTEGYRKHKAKITSRVGAENIKRSHEKFAAMSPEEKAQIMKQRFGGICALEQGLADQLKEQGVFDIEMDCWQSLEIDGKQVARQADIKVSVGDGRKIVVLCDGEAFHGPKTVFGDPETKIASDRATALAYFDLGYSVARYSETEIHDGFALSHILGLVTRLESCQKVYRNWHPLEEITY